MTEQTTTEVTTKGTNTIGLVALVLSIVGLLLVLSIFWSPFGIIILVLALILGLIGIFKEPRGKAITGFIISLLGLFGIGYAIYWTTTAVIEPATEFATWLTQETQHNTEMRLVFKQPWFESFLENRVEIRFTNMDRSQFKMTGNIKTTIKEATAIFLEEVKAEIIDSVDAWIAQYGLPNPEDDLLGINENVPGINEGMMDDDVILDETWDIEPLSTEEINALLSEEEMISDEDAIIQELDALINSLD